MAGEIIKTCKYIYFELLKTLPKTYVFEIYNKRSNSLLGYIKWHSAWRKYCKFDIEGAVFDEDCLSDVVGFLKEQNESHKIGFPLYADSEKENWKTR